MNRFQTIKSVFSNKYFLSVLAFATWMLFFDDKDVSTMLARHKKLKELQKSEVQLSKQINETRKELNLLKTSAQTVEKYAREKYFMKKDNEDLFVIPESQ